MARLFLTISAAILFSSAGLAAWQRPDLVPGIAQSGTIRVDSPNGLAQAVAAATAGSQILLAPGDYPMISINRAGDADGRSGIRISGPREARIAGLRFGPAASGWQVDGVTVLGPADNSAAIDVSGGRRITLSRVLVNGTAPGDGPENEAGAGLNLRGASAITLADSEVRHVRLVMRIWDVRGLVVSGNHFHGAREGLAINGAHGLVIHHNHFEDWRPRFDLGEHPDMIQFFNRYVADGTNDVSIIGNLMVAGDDWMVQGLFGGAQDFQKGLAPNGFMRNMVVRNNIYYGSAYHAISLGDVDGIVVENNTVLASPHAFVGKQPPDPAGRTSSGTMPRILLGGVRGARVTGNIAPRVLQRRVADPPAVVENNFSYEPRVPDDALNPGRSFAAPLVKGLSRLTDFAVLPQSEAGKRRQGADISAVGPAAANHDVAALAAQARALAEAPLPPASTLQLPP